jgi:single-stranded-DNA-specific exonuclease
MPLAITRREPNTELPLGKDLNPLLRRVLSQRGIGSINELDLAVDKLLPPSDLLGMTEAVELLLATQESKGKIVVVSDFDADGATSCALGMLALRSMGFENVDYIVPNRFEYGYGLTPEIVALAAGKKPDLIITVDNGISSIDGVEAANTLGIKVLITDHHLPGKELPAAAAIVNPNQPGCSFASKSLAGVGVVFYLMLALRSKLREREWFTANPQFKVPNMASFLDLVALGTVADVVPLDQNNRILVNHGIKRIKARQARPGLLALLSIGKREPQNLVASDLGFTVGPRLNAAGRLDDMSLGIECLLTDSDSEAFNMALQLDRLNSDRRLIEGEMQAQAFEALEQLSLNDENVPSGICVYKDTWHQGVIGILASRIKDRFHRPVIAFADAGEGTNELKGSARSISGFHIRDALDAVASQNPGLINKFGGHAMAAGLSLDKACFEEFSRAFDHYAENTLSEATLQMKILTDGEVEESDLNLNTAEELASAGPWGQGFPEPLFDGLFKLIGYKVLAEKHLKMAVSPGDSNLEIEAIAFNVKPERFPQDNANLHLVYRLEVNSFRDIRKTQLVIQDFEEL